MIFSVYLIIIAYYFIMCYLKCFMIYFKELANAGRPLFPGSDVDDQLKRIFKYPL